MKLSVIIFKDVDHNFIPDDFAENIANQSLPKSDFEVIFLLSDQHKAFYKEFISQLKSSHVNLKVYKDLYTNGRPGIINRSIDKSNNEVLLFLADDFVPSYDLFKIHLDSHREDQSKKLITYGPSLFPEYLKESSPFRKWLEDSAKVFGRDFLHQDVYNDLYFYLGNSSIKKELIQHVGFFNEELKYETHDDFEFKSRIASMNCYSKYLKKAHAIHDHPVTERERYSQMKKAGYSTGIIYKKSIKTYLSVIKSFIKIVINLLRFKKPKEHRRWEFNCEKFYLIGLLNYIKTNRWS